MSSAIFQFRRECVIDLDRSAPPYSRRLLFETCTRSLLITSKRIRLSDPPAANTIDVFISSSPAQYRRGEAHTLSNTEWNIKTG